jgi:hypothetical protein
MYPGEPGTYTTLWDDYNTTTSPQKYIGATYDSSNTATVPKTFMQVDNAPYKTTFSDGTVSYSIVKFGGLGIRYTEVNETDCHYSGAAPDGFVVTDFEYNAAKNEITLKEDFTLVESTGNEGKYTTYLDGSQNSDYYKTSQPILRVSYTKSSSGENYYGSYTNNNTIFVYPYATVWDDGKTTYSIVEFNGVTYADEETKEYSTDNEERTWHVGAAPAGHKESDYVYDEDLEKYKYVGSSGALVANPSPEDAEVLEDAEDIISEILENDGLQLRQ